MITGLAPDTEQTAIAFPDSRPMPQCNAIRCAGWRRVPTEPTEPQGGTDERLPTAASARAGADRATRTRYRFFVPASVACGRRAAAADPLDAGRHRRSRVHAGAR